MKILGVGLSKTGTSSLHNALKMLGFSSLHHDTVRLTDIIDGSNSRPNFRRYDDVDAVIDLPAAYFYDELTKAYPNCRCILTIRDSDEWWQSASFHFNNRFKLGASLFRGRRAALKEYLKSPIARYKPSALFYPNEFRIQLRNYVYGSAIAHEYLYKKKYDLHNERVLRTIPRERLLVMNITSGDGWETLCPFLGVASPSALFPHAYSSRE